MVEKQALVGKLALAYTDDPSDVDLFVGNMTMTCG